MIRRRTHRLVAWVDEQTFNSVKNYCKMRNADRNEYVGELINRGLRDRNEDYRAKLFEKMDEKAELEKRLREFERISIHQDAEGYFRNKAYHKLMIIKKHDYRDTAAALELRDMLVFMGLESWGEFTEIILDGIKNGDIWIEGGKIVRRKTSLKAQRAQKRAGYIKQVNKWCRIEEEENERKKTEIN